MKITALSLLALTAGVSAGGPSLSISVQDGSYGGLDGLDPSLSWSSSSSSGDVELEYGVDMKASSLNIASLPKKVWGKASLDLGGWATSVRADADASDLGNADLTIDSVNGDTSLKMFASAGGGFKVSSIEATKTFDSDGASVSVNPRYNLETEEADVVIGYDAGDTSVELTASADSQSVVIGHSMGDTSLSLTASADAQSLTLSQKIDDDNTVSPTFGSDGSMSLAWERSLGDGNSLTTTLKPNESVDMEWKDAAWTANINLGLDGASVSGANVSVKRDVNF
jgi:hypothetical protein